MMSLAPPDRIIPIVLSLLFYTGGFLACSGAAFRLLKYTSISAAFVFGFVLWNTAIVLAAVLSDLVELFHPWLFLLLPIAPAIAGVFWTPWRALGNKLHAELRFLWENPLAQIPIIALLAFFAYWFFFNLYIPPFGWDTVTYHRPSSFFFLQIGELHNFPTISMPARVYPKNTEIVSAWLIGWAGWTAPARVFPLFQLFAALMAAYSIARMWQCPRPIAALLAATAIASPGILRAVIMDNGDVDLHAAAICLGALMFIQGIVSHPNARKSYLSAAMLSIAFLAGLKGTSILFGGILGLALVITLIALRFPWKTIAAVIAINITLGIIVSGYWIIHNIADYGNPLGTFEIKLGGTVLVEGHTKMDDVLWQSPENSPGEGWKGFITSVRDNKTMAFFLGRHIGGWGFHFGYIVLYIWPIAMLVVLFRRQWDRLLIFVTIAAILFATPSYWWARFGFIMVLSGPLAAVIILNPLKSKHLVNLLALVFFLEAAFFVTAWSIRARESVYVPQMKERASGFGRDYLIPLDSFHLFDNMEQDPVLQFYHWLEENIHDSRISYDFGTRDDFLQYMFNSRMTNHVSHRWIPEESRLRDLDNTDYFIVTTDHPQANGMANWKEAFRNSAYVVFTPER